MQSIFKFLFVLISLLCCIPSSNAQNTTVVTESLDNNDDEKIYVYVGEWPEFPGGNEARNKFLSQNIDYPLEAEMKGIEGRSIIGFTVKKTGDITDVKVLKSAGYAPLDSEAVRVVRIMPRWKPGKNNGVAVNTKHKVDVVYKIPPGVYFRNLSCDSSKFSPGSYPVYGTKQPYEFQRATQSILNRLDNPSVAGELSISFTITKDNKLTDLSVLKSTDPSLEKEVLNIIKQLSEGWKAGLKNGKPIQAKYQADFLFKI